MLPSTRLLQRAALLLASVPLSAAPVLAQRTIHVPADQPTIQAGINAAINGDTVLVAPGTYSENIDFAGKAITVGSEGGAAVTKLQSNAATAATVSFHTQEARASVLQGFTITNLNGSGALYITEASPLVRDNILLNNACLAISSFYASPSIQNNRITGTATSSVCANTDTTGISVRWIDPYHPNLSVEILGNTLTQNDFTGTGGTAIFVATSRAHIVANRITHNTAESYGSALIATYEWALTTANNVIANNTSTTGAAVYLSSAINGYLSSAFINNTVVDNQQTASTTNATQIIIQGLTSGAYNGLLLANNLVVANTANPLLDCGQTYHFSDGPYGNSAQLSNNILSNSGTGGTFNSVCRSSPHDLHDTFVAPTFIDRANGDYHLVAHSQGIDSGNNSVVQVAYDRLGYTLAQDADGYARVSNTGGGMGAQIDIGAFEFDHAANHPGLTLLLNGTSSLFLQDAVPFGQPLTLTIQASAEVGLPTGLVSVADLQGATYPPVSLDATGAATITTGPLTPGVHAFVATCFACSPTDAASTPLTVLVAPGTSTTTLMVVSSQNPAPRGTPVRLAVTLQSSSGTPSGTLTFSEGSTLLGNAAISNGSANFDLPTTLTRGSHALTIAYPGDGMAPAASTTFVQTITGVPSLTSLTASATTVSSGTPITLTSAVLSTSGVRGDLMKVQILDGSQPLAPLAVSTNAVTITTTFAAGTHTLTAVFAGDSNLEPSTSAPVIVTVQGAPTTLTLTTSPAQPVAFQSLVAGVTITATTGTPRGTVALTVDGKPAASFASVAAAAAGATLSLPAGTYALSASFTPTDNSSLAGTASAQLIVARAPVSLSFVTPLPAPFPQSLPATLSALLDDGTGRHLASGTIVPVIDGAPLAPLNPAADGHVSLQLTGLSIGAHTVAFTYAGDSNFLPAMTATAQITILDRDFALRHDTEMTVPAGSYILRSIALQSIGDFSGPVTLSCENLPVAASCRFAQLSPSLIAAGSTTVQFALDTSALPGYRQSATLRPFLVRAGTTLAALLAPLGLLFGSRRRRRLPTLFAVSLVSLALSAALLGCSGQLPAYTPPGTYTVQIVGESGTLRHTRTVTLHVANPAH